MINFIKFHRNSLRKFHKNIISDKAIRNVFILLTGSGIAQLIPVFTAPILSRIYYVDNFGELALFVNIVSPLVIIATGRFEEAILLPKNKIASVNIVAGSVIITFLFSVVLISTSIILKLFFHSHFSYQGLHNWVLLVPVSVFSLAIFNILNSFANRYGLYNQMSLSKIWKSIVTFGIKLTGGLKDMGAIGLIIGNLSGNIFSAIFISYIFFKYKKHQIRHVTWERIFSALGKYTDFPKYSMTRALTNTLSSGLPVFILYIFFGNTVTGQYSMALVLSFIPVNLFAQAIYQVYFQNITDKYNKKETITKNIAGIAKWIAIILIVPFIFITVFAADLTEFILGEDWRESGVILRYLMPWLFMVAVSTPLAFVPKLANKLKAEMFIEITYLVLRTVALFIGVLLMNYYYSILLFSISGVIILGFNILWYLHLARGLDRRL